MDQMMSSDDSCRYVAFVLFAGTFVPSSDLALAQAPATTLLALSKDDHTVAIVDPSTLQVLARIPSGPDPHEIIASDDGQRAYISNYGGSDSTLNTISVVDLVARKALPAIDLGALRSTHGLDFAGGKLYFTAETNKIIGRYGPRQHKRVDWILGTGQDRTHMIHRLQAEATKRIFTSNVNSATVPGIIEQVSQPNGGFTPPPGGSPGVWTWRPSAASSPARHRVVRAQNMGSNELGLQAARSPEGFDVSPDGKEDWVANARDSGVTIIDIAAKAVKRFRSRSKPVAPPGNSRPMAVMYSSLASARAEVMPASWCSTRPRAKK